MLTLHLDRIWRDQNGTYGKLYRIDAPDWQTLWTLEEEWRDNRPDISCIPAGDYTCERTVYHKHGYETFEVLDVPGRTRILFHPGNTEEDTGGCIMLGLDVGLLRVRDEESGRLTRKVGIVRSKEAFIRFMGALVGIEQFNLNITEPAL